jgi:hypothetical protein
MDDLRARVAAKLALKRARERVVPDPPPRYDEVYAQDVAWLDAPEDSDEAFALACLAAEGETRKSDAQVVSEARECGEDIAATAARIRAVMEAAVHAFRASVDAGGGS